MSDAAAGAAPFVEQVLLYDASLLTIGRKRVAAAEFLINESLYPNINGSCLWMGGSMSRKESRATNGHPAELKKKKRPLCSSLLYCGLFCYEADPLI